MGAPSLCPPRNLGLADIRLPQPALRIPYLDASGAEVAIRLRVGLNGPDKYRWKTGSKPALYGLLEDPAAFRERWAAAIAAAVPWSVYAQAEADRRAEVAKTS